MLFCLCFAAQVSSIPVVDDNDSLLDIYCRRLVVIQFAYYYLLMTLICCNLFVIYWILPTEWCFLFSSSAFLYSDITALAKDRAYAHINLNEMTIHQVTALIFSLVPEYYIVFSNDLLVYIPVYMLNVLWSEHYSD
jgi:hypothetical protein